MPLPDYRLGSASASRFHLFPTCDSLSPRQPQPARRDDVALDLARAAADGRGAGGEVVADDAAVQWGARVLGTDEVALGAEDVHPGEGDALVQLAVVELGDRRLFVRD